MAALVMAQALGSGGGLPAALLRRAAAWASDVAPGAAWVAHAPEDDVAGLLPEGTRLIVQRGESAGERLARATQEAFAEGADRLLVITPDVPRLRSEHAAAAFGDLDAGCDVVVGPKFGGGIYLLGLARPAPELFELAPEAWAGDEVTSLIFRRVAESGLSLGFLRHERDLSTPNDAAAALADPLYPREIVDLLRGGQNASSYVDIIHALVFATTRHNERSTTPPFLRLAGHPLRWRLLSELARSDRRVGELCDLTGRRQSLVSYHLRRLRDGGLVSMRRSAADGRDTYYVVDLARCGQLLVSAGVSLHPGLAATPTPVQSARGDHGPALARVLFLCTGNSARSQIAEALAEQLSGGAVSAASAGSHPKTLHPNAVRVMSERGIDIRGHRTKHLSEFSGERFDYVISLCDRVREVCPEFPGGPALIHWSIPDPSREPGSDEETLPAFQRTAAELSTRIGFLIQEVTARA